MSEQTLRTKVILRQVLFLEISLKTQHTQKAVTRTLIERGAVYIFIHSCSARQVSFQIKFKSISLKRNLSSKI